MKTGFAAALAVMLLSGAVSAHTGTGEHTHSLSSGFAHPFTGLDHMLVMVAVGLYAMRATASPILLPAVFVAFMALGGALGAFGVPVAFAEEGILASVAIMAVLALAAPRMSLVLVAPMVAAFAILHGYAHGAEMAAGEAFLPYAVGFVVATALLHGAGVGIGALLPRGLPKLGRARG